jgi:hypothetical protein
VPAEVKFHQCDLLLNQGRPLQLAGAEQRAATCQRPETSLSFQLYLCLSRACLGKRSVFRIEWRKQNRRRFPHLPAATPRPAGHPHNHTCRNISFNSTFRMRPSRACLGKYSGFSIKQRHKDLETFLSLRTSQGPALRHAMAGGDRPPCGKRHF